MFLLWEPRETLLHMVLQVDLTCDAVPRQLGSSPPISKARLSSPSENQACFPQWFKALPLGTVTPLQHNCGPPSGP